MYPVPNDEGDGAFEGLFHLGLAVVVVGRGRLGSVGTLRLEKWLGIHEWSGCGERMDAVDLDGHWLDMAVSVDGDNERADLLSVHCFGELGFSGTSSKSTRPTLSHENLHVRCPVRWSVHPVIQSIDHQDFSAHSGNVTPERSSAQRHALVLRTRMRGRSHSRFETRLPSRVLAGRGRAQNDPPPWLSRHRTSSYPSSTSVANLRTTDNPCRHWNLITARPGKHDNVYEQLMDALQAVNVDKSTSTSIPSSTLLCKPRVTTWRLIKGSMG